MRSHYVLTQATCACIAFLLSFILGANCQTNVSSSIPSSLSTRPPSSSVFSSTSGVSLGITGTSTGTADFPTLSGYSDCVTNCFAVAVASRNCPSLTAPQCYCNSTNVEGFKQSMISCLTGGCPQELLTGEQLARMFCNVGPSATSISFPPLSSNLSSTSVSVSASSTVTSPSPSQTTGNSNGASGGWGDMAGVGGGYTVVFGILIGLGSILVGGVSA